MRLSKITIAIVIFAVFGAGMLAQDPRGKILGLVTDTSGAVIPGASVTAIHREMNTRTPTVTNQAGNYELPFLLPGTYQLVVEAKGFKRYTREPIGVRVGDSITLNVTLEVGAATESINITAEAPLLESSTASLGLVYDRNQLKSLPTGGGNAMYLIQLTPGVFSIEAPGHHWLPGATGSIGNVSMGGIRSRSSEFTLDGIPNMTQQSPAFAPPLDMVQELRVDIVTYDASLGHSAGGAINMSLKSGTNTLHGGVRWDVGPRPWQANSFFTNKQIYDPTSGPVTESKIRALSPSRKFNRYSGTLGGPVYLPGIYDGRNRTFWIYGYQGYSQRMPTSGYYTVPTPAEAGGNLSALLRLAARSTRSTIP